VWQGYSKLEEISSFSTTGRALREKVYRAKNCRFTKQYLFERKVKGSVNEEMISHLFFMDFLARFLSAIPETVLASGGMILIHGHRLNLSWSCRKSTPKLTVP